MSSSDPIYFAARASAMTDGELLTAIRTIEDADKLSAYDQAMLDEAKFRSIARKREVKSSRSPDISG